MSLTKAQILPPFLKGGGGGISLKSLKIPLNPPFLKGDLKETVLKLMTLRCQKQVIIKRHRALEVLKW